MTFPLVCLISLKTLNIPGTSLVVQWLRLCLPMQGRRFNPGWGTKIPHAAGQLSLCTLEPVSHN